MSDETTDDRTPYLLKDSPNGYWRDWCIDCGEPMRVLPTHVGGSLCQDCARTNNDPEVAHLTPRQAIGKTKLALEDLLECQITPQDV